LKSTNDRRKFKVLNQKLQSLLDKQIDFEIITNLLINWDSKDWLYKEHLLEKYKLSKDKISILNKIIIKIINELDLLTSQSDLTDDQMAELLK